MKIDISTCQPALTTLRQLVKIAMKAHGNNSSPVDIKLELADLPADMLMQIDEDITRTLQQFDHEPKA